MKNATQSADREKQAPLDLASESLPKESRLFLLSQAIATTTPGFFDVKGPGPGNLFSNDFMRLLRGAAKRLFGSDCSEKRVCGGAKFALDFYFPDEATAVEVALGLRNPSSEFERDIFKCLLAAEEGSEVEKLVFITKPGGHLRCMQVPGASAIRGYVNNKFEIEIEIRELFDGAGTVQEIVEYVARHQLWHTRDEQARSIDGGRICAFALRPGERG
jgi:hypothetical protein